MQLGSDTIPELTKLKAGKQAKMQGRRGEILTFVTVDSKDQLIVDPQYKVETKAIINDLGRLAKEIAEIDSLIDEVNDAATELGFRDFGQQRQRFTHTIQQSNMTLQKGVINGILSKAQCTDLEISVNAAKESLAKLEQVTAPLIERLEKLDIIK